MKLAPPPAALLSLFKRRMDKAVTIQRPVVINGLQQYQDWLSVPAAINPGSGVESASGALDPTNIATTSVYIEFVAGVLLSMQVLYAGRRLEIISASNLVEADLVLLLVCREAQV